MPIVEPSSFPKPRFALSGHWQTILPALWRPLAKLPGPVSERIETKDGDFLDLDWYTGMGGDKVAILTHGLEGSSRAGYIRGMAKALRGSGWDVLAWNFRSCSGELNRTARFYHSGETGDLHRVVERACECYRQVALVGFSLGGNVILKYLGEESSRAPAQVRVAVTFSVPCDLAASARRLDRPENLLYTRRFLRSLKQKVKTKAAQAPGAISADGVDRIRTFREFDDRYTAPMHGFKDAAEYWRQSSCRPFLPRIRIPSLLVNALNDPFLTPECYPREEAEKSAYFHLEMPAHGGHLGFAAGWGRFWSETRAVEFLNLHDQ
jgi:uncharacterized protein